MSKILIINKYYSNVIGGIETVVKDYALTLSSEHDIVVLACNDKIFKKTLIYEENNHLRVYLATTLLILQKLPISFSFIYYFLKLSRNADIIYLHEPFPLGSLICYLFSKKKKIVVSWHSDILNQKFLLKIVKPFQNLILQKAEVIITTSPPLLENSEQLKIHKDKISIIPLSIEPNKMKVDFSKVSNEVIDFAKSNSEFCLSFGRLSYYKGVDIIESTYRNHELMPLFIAGVGEEKLAEKLNSIASDFPERFFFLNRFLTENEKNYLLSKACFFLFPSTKITEAFGITQLEAMKYSLPVINCNISTGVPWVSINGLTGITLERGTSIELKNAIQYLSDNIHIRLEMGRNARSRLLDVFSNEKNFCLLSEVFENLNIE